MEKKPINNSILFNVLILDNRYRVHIFNLRKFSVYVAKLTCITMAYNNSP